MAKRKNKPKTNGHIRGVTEVDTFVGGRIRALRNLKKITQEELGTALGVTFQQVQKYEKGINRVSGSRLLDLASFFGCDVSEFLDGAPTDGQAAKHVDRKGAVSTAGLDEMASNQVGVRLIRAYLALEKPKLRIALADFAEQLAASA